MKRQPARERFLLSLKQYEVKLEKLPITEVEDTLLKMQKKIKADKECVGLDDNADLRAIYCKIVAKYYIGRLIFFGKLIFLALPDIKMNKIDEGITELKNAYRAYLEYFGPF